MKYVSNLFFNTAWAIHQDLIGPMMEAVERHENGAKLSDEEIVRRIEAAQGSRPKREGYSISQVKNGVATIPIYGVIGKRFSAFERMSMEAADVSQIQDDLEKALSDNSVQKIVLDIDSPGGSANGVAELSDFIYGSRSKKPIMAVANGMMCSAAYWIGSAAQEIYTTKGSYVGSIGVYSVVSDYTVLEHNKGIKSQVIKAGQHKAAGHPQKNLSAEDIEVIRERVDSVYDLFVDAVARNRGISRSKALDMANGKVWIGQKAVDLGLADKVSAFDSILGGSNGAIKASESIDIDGHDKKNNSNTEVSNMEIKDLTIEQLQEGNPDLVKQIQEQALQGNSENGQAEFDKAIEEAKAEEKKAADEAVAAERQRSENICGLLKTKQFSAYAETAEECIKNGDSVEAAESKLKDLRLADLEKNAPEAVAPGDGNHKETAKEGDQYQEHVKRAEAYKKDHKCSMTEALKATVKG